MSDLRVRLVRTYFVNGVSRGEQRGAGWDLVYEVSDPVSVGWASAILIGSADGQQVTILDPFFLKAWSVNRSCGEVKMAKKVDVPDEKVVELLTKSWEALVARGSEADFATAALAISTLKGAVPTSQPPKREANSSGINHHAFEEKYFQPVRPGSVRASIVEFFQSGPKSIFEAQAKFGFTRSNVLSHLFCLNKYNGIGYTLTGDTVSLVAPEGRALIGDGTPKVKAALMAEASERADKATAARLGKPLEESRFKQIELGSKRAGVVKAMLTWAHPAKVGEQLAISKGAVVSHLYSAWQANGIGYETNEEGLMRVLLPQGKEVFK